MLESPLDFPQVWQKPAFPLLLATLQRLRVDPPAWNLKASRNDILKHQETPVQDPREIAAYLSTIIKSPLGWLDDDDRETIWDEASKRFSERCGRSAMSEITRRWPFEGDADDSFDLILREPALTGDNLGLKTWGSSYVLAQMLYTIGETSLAHLFGKGVSQPRPAVLEMGSGTGLLGLAAAAIWRTRVILSDLPEIVPNLAHNVEKNLQTVQGRGGSLASGALTWGGDGDEIDPILFTEKNSFNAGAVIVADPLYDDHHPGLLAGAVDDQLSLDANARVVIMVPQRDAVTVNLLSMLRQELASKTTPFVCLEETIVPGRDDWGASEDEEAGHVKCWLGIFARQNVVNKI
ncbi:hypothetical protein J7T55_002686 [Diaporthe amygdali]|uniref:uncharacterized protein n=1 Tax=Phomopsis amygdali TaxID=1214568 RepID=UPI0022FE929F|nr:uncharacterized protein J7T55_002686 [Diaporthe amygdali]KAJ0122174.1 hypothetical protein J7T55_002686 [Diaporthe amygdali]